MTRGFPAADLQNLRFAVCGNDAGVEHAFDFGKRPVLSRRLRIGIADRTGEIAGSGDFDERDAALLAVIGAETAVQRASL